MIPMFHCKDNGKVIKDLCTNRVSGVNELAYLTKLVSIQRVTIEVKIKLHKIYHLHINRVSEAKDYTSPACLGN